MNSSWRRGVLVLCVCGVSRYARAWDTPRNPDLRPSFGFQSGGGADLHATQTITASKTGQTETRGIGNQTLNFFTDALFPLSDHWSVQAGAGIVSDYSTSNSAVLLGASGMDRTSVNAAVTSRYYLLDHSLVGATLSENPDQCPSFAVTVSGNDSIYREQTDVSNGAQAPRQGGLNQTLNFAGDTRLPVANAVTLLANATATFSATAMPQTATANGSETRTKTIAYGGGLKYYFVGKNAIAHDDHKNPDRWTSLSFIGDAISTIKGHVVTTSAATGTEERGVQTTGYTLTSELRIPITNNLSFRIQVSGGQTFQDVPVSPTNAGTKTTTPSFSGFAGIRGYFL